MAGAAGEFGVAAELIADAASPRLRVSFAVPDGHYLYADQISVEPEPPVRFEPLEIPRPESHFDSYSEAQRDIYPRPFSFLYAVAGASGPFKVTVRYQGCNESMCFLPATAELAVGGAAAPGAGPAGEGGGAAPEVAAGPAADWATALEGFRLREARGGYLGAGDFLAFLRGEGGGSFWERAVKRGGVLSILLILLGGLALNLTPCVLPMIPVTLAIIGAGARAGSRLRGLGLGLLYGLGMTVAYGLLGIVVVLTGSFFGTINSSPWFNLAIAALFAVLSLAMFDVFSIDLSRFQPSGPGSGSGARAGWIVIPFMGALSAVLAGACVAPVVLAVLTYAAGLYSAGGQWALALPFVLGAGMALPWPFAGAGLAVLPKPGRWMSAVKVVFGIVILLLALYYGRNAWKGFAWRSSAGRPAAEAAAPAGGAWLTDLRAGLERGRAEGRPVLVDFWATWCKNCLAMEETTFRDPEVIRALDAFVKVKYQAERPGEPGTREVLARFGVVGLPTYVILDPESAPAK